MSLNNLGNCLSKLGRHEEAMTPAREAVDLFRALASARPDAFRPGLAMSLNNLGNHLSELGRREEAQTPAREAVDIRRALARARPDAFRPDLAMSLGNLGNRLGELGRREEALTAAEEAVDLYRALARTRPDAFRPDLARSLGVLGYCMTALGQNVESAKAFHEGMSVLLPHLVKSPSVFGELARDLTDDYSDACDAAGIEPDAQLLAAMDAALEGAHGALQPSSIEHPASSSAPTPLTTP
jgi:tetratricopeptide (TPR) repeat protein